MGLEAQLTHRGIACIQHISYAPIERQLTLQFTACTADYTNDATLVFSAVQAYSDVWHSPEDEVLADQDGDSLIGLDEYPVSGGVRYVIETERREIIVVTAAAPGLHSCTPERWREARWRTPWRT